MTRAPIGGSRPPVEANAESPHLHLFDNGDLVLGDPPAKTCVEIFDPTELVRRIRKALTQRLELRAGYAPDELLYSQLVGIGRGRELASPGLAGYCLPSIPRAGATFKAAHDGDAQAAVRRWAQTPIMALRKMRKVAKGRHVVFPAPATS